MEPFDLSVKLECKDTLTTTTLVAKSRVPNNIQATQPVWWSLRDWCWKTLEFIQIPWITTFAFDLWLMSNLHPCFFFPFKWRSQTRDYLPFPSSHHRKGTSNFKLPSEVTHSHIFSVFLEAKPDRIHLDAMLLPSTDSDQRSKVKKLSWPALKETLLAFRFEMIIVSFSTFGKEIVGRSNNFDRRFFFSKNGVYFQVQNFWNIGYVYQFI